MENNFSNQRAWYVVQSYSGCEYAAKRNLESRIESMNMQDYIFRVLIPETIREEKKKNGDIKEIREKIFPGYIFVDMIVTDESWFIVRNTPMVTGFLGSSGGGTKPVPLPPEEIIPILRGCGISLEAELKFKVGDTVQIMVEPFVGQEVEVSSIDTDKQLVTVLVEVFGRLTPQELHFDEVKPII